jgi:hypothetical protein
MDTIGDAYIVAGFVGPADGPGPSSSTASSSGTTGDSCSSRRPSACCAAYGAGRGSVRGGSGVARMQAVCWDMLFVARAMIETIAKYRTKERRDAHCRFQCVCLRAHMCNYTCEIQVISKD